MTLWPASLAGRTALWLLLGLACVQTAGLLIHALDRVELQRLAEGRDLGRRVVGLYRTIVAAPPEQWPEVVRTLETGSELQASLESTSPRGELDPAPPGVQSLIRPYLMFGRLPRPLRPHEVAILGGRGDGRLIVGLDLPDERWLVVHTQVPPPRPWHSGTFLIAFALMTLTAAALTLWAVRRLTAPVRTLAEAAERLGRDVNAPPLPETGPREIATAAVSFNTMAARIRRFVEDRTFLLTALGHDLRTPITRLKLRAEWMQDDEQRDKMLADLDQLESMVSATLAFGRDVAASENSVPLDLAVLLRTVLDEAADAAPGVAVNYAGPPHLTVHARPVALKRAFVNLVANAVAYGGSAHVTLQPARAGSVMVTVENGGPAIPADQLERVFEPFYRLDASRNSETGGTGLGLPIARAVLRAHGGEIVLSNRAEGGVCATVTLPV